MWKWKKQLCKPHLFVVGCFQVYYLERFFFYPLRADFIRRPKSFIDLSFFFKMLLLFRVGDLVLSWIRWTGLDEFLCCIRGPVFSHLSCWGASWFSAYGCQLEKFQIQQLWENGKQLSKNQEENKSLYLACPLVIQGLLTLSYWNRNNNHSVWRVKHLALLNTFS